MKKGERCFICFIEIKDVSFDEIDSLIDLCIPPERRGDGFFKGIKAKKDWALNSLNRFGEVAKIAYLDSKPAGLIQYQPRIKEKLMEEKIRIKILYSGYVSKSAYRRILLSITREVVAGICLFFSRRLQ